MKNRKIVSSSQVQLCFLALSSLLLLMLVVVPIISLFQKAFEDANGNPAGLHNFFTYFNTPNLTASLWNSLFVSCVTMLVSVTLALVYAYALTRTRLPGRRILRFTAMLPLFAPTMMLGIGLMYLLGNKGLITALGVGLPLYGPLGIILSEIIYTFPQALLILTVSLSFADNRLYEAADVMGASPARKLFTITLPGIRYGLISAMFVAFTLSFTDFGAPKVVGGNYNVLATDIYKQVVGQQNFTMEAVVGMILMIPAVLSFVVDRITQNGNRGVISSKSVSLVVKSSIARDVVLGGFCALVNLCIFVLLGAVVLAAMVNVWPYDLSLTLKHFLADSPATGGIGSYFNSVTVSLLTALLGTALVFCIAYLIEKTRGAKLLRQSLYLLCILPLALPGLAIGIAYIFFFSNPGNPMNGVYGTMWILVLANLIHFFSVPFVTATSALKKLDREFELVSESMNVPFYKTFYRVTVPMSLPALLEIFVYYFVNSMVTVSAMVFLYPAHFKLAAIAIVNMEDAGDIAPAAALSVLVLLTNVTVRLGYEWAVSRLKARSVKTCQVKSKRSFSIGRVLPWISAASRR